MMDIQEAINYLNYLKKYEGAAVYILEDGIKAIDTILQTLEKQMSKKLA